MALVRTMVDDVGCRNAWRDELLLDNISCCHEINFFFLARKKPGSCINQMPYPYSCFL